MADDIEVLNGDEFLVVIERTGEEQFIVLTAIQRTGDDIQVHLLRQGCRLKVDRQFVFVDAAAHAALRTDMHQLGRQSVTHVHHRGRLHTRLAQRLQDIASRFGFQLPLQQVFLTREIRLFGIRHSLALQQLQTHISRSEVAGYTDEIIQFGTVAIDDIFLFGHPQTGDTDGQAGHRRTGVATYDIHTITLARQAHARVQSLYVLYRETLTNTQTHCNLSRCTVHRIDIREINHRSLVPQVFQRHIFQIEMNTLQQHIRCHQGQRLFSLSFRKGLGVGLDYRAIITYSFDRGRLHGFNVFGQFFDESELTQ